MAAITNDQKAKINRICPITRDVKLGDVIQGLGAFSQATYQANSTAPDITTMKNDFNALLTKLKAAGLMANS